MATGTKHLEVGDGGDEQDDDDVDDNNDNDGDNCHFLYANAISRPGKGTPKKCVNSRHRLTTKHLIEMAQSSLFCVLFKKKYAGLKKSTPTP